MSHIKNICQLFQNYSRDELKKIDEQTGGLKGKESSRKLSNEEKQIQVASSAHLVHITYYINLHQPSINSPASSDGRASDCRSIGRWFEPLLGRKYFQIYKICENTVTYYRA